MVQFFDGETGIHHAYMADDQLQVHYQASLRSPICTIPYSKHGAIVMGLAMLRQFAPELLREAPPTPIPAPEQVVIDFPRRRSA